MKKWILILILVAGCGKELPDANLTITTGTETFTQITAKPVEEDKLPTIGGKDEETIIAVITVPASTIATTVYVYDDVKKPFRPRKKSEPVKPVSTVSTNPETEVYYPEVTPWWYWWIGYIIAACVVYFIGKKYFDILTKPIKWVMKLWDLLKNK